MWLPRPLEHSLLEPSHHEQAQATCGGAYLERNRGLAYSPGYTSANNQHQLASCVIEPNWKYILQTNSVKFQKPTIQTWNTDEPAMLKAQITYSQAK